MRRAKLIEYCKENLQYDDVGIVDFSEFAQFSEETLRELVPYLTTEGLHKLKQAIDRVREQMNKPI